MFLEYVPQYREETDAASARFPGDAADPRAPGAPARSRALGWCAAVVAGALFYLLLNTRGRAGGALWNALVQADRIDHPVFITGILLVAVGAAMVVVPLAYLFALRRSSRPLTDQPVRADLGEDFLTLRLPARELTIAWDGIVAVAETRHLFVLKTVGDLRLALPKRAAPGYADSPKAVDDLRDLLRRRVAPLADVAPALTAATPPAPRLAA